MFNRFLPPTSRRNILDAPEFEPFKLTRNTVHVATPAPGLAPSEPFVRQIPLPHGDLDDSPQILSVLQQLAEAFAQSAWVREFTVRNVFTKITDNDLEKQVKLLLAWVRSNVTYVRDPIGTEYVISPLVLLGKIANGELAAGDCDDHVLLLNSMLGSVGFETRAVGVHLYEQDRWDHVISSVLVRGRWIDLDPCDKHEIGQVYLEKLVT